MRSFEALFFMLTQSFIFNYIISMTVHVPMIVPLRIFDVKRKKWMQ